MPFNLKEANEFLTIKFLDKINQKFAKSPMDKHDAHRDPAPYGNLDEIFCWKYTRQLKKDWTIRFVNEYYQILKGYEKLLKPTDFIIIKKYLNDI